MKLNDKIKLYDTNKKPKWYTTLEIIDVETGEEITKSYFERNNYIIIEKETKKEFDDEKNRGYTRIRWLTKRSSQLKLF